MLPGPEYVYKCPKCGHILTNGSMRSGNTFGAKIFSDGKRIAPMHPEFPNLTKCRKCDAIFWLSKLEEIGIYESGDKISSDWKHADKVDFLGIKDYRRALDNGVAESSEEELFIRQQIWWIYNDRKRDGRNQFVNDEDEIEWRSNCSRLISLFDQNDINQKIMTAELKRNLGDFESCIEIINSLDSGEFNWLKDKFITECELKNRWVVQLS